MLIALTVILIALILLLCGDRGAKSIVTTVIQASFLLAAIFLIYRGLPPVPVTAAACLAIAAAALFYQNEADTKSRAAFLSVAVVILLLLPLVWYLAAGANSEGFNSEQYEITDTNGYTRNIGLDMLSLQISVMIIALIGTVIDIAIAIVSSVSEVLLHNRDLSLRKLTGSAFAAGQAILNTSIHTIFYIYMAEYLTLFIQYADEYSLSRLINSKSFCQEFISISVSGLGCCLIVPVAAILGSWILYRDAKKKRPCGQDPLP